MILVGEKKCNFCKNTKTFILFFTTIFFLNTLFSVAQPDSTKKFRNRKIVFASLSGVAYTGSIIGLDQLWYKQYSTGLFHFFNDNNEWLQLDKVGHAYTTYQVGRAGIDMMRWAGCKPKVATWVGGMSGSVFMTTIEVLDGFSSGWGFSWGDMTANISGSLLATTQDALWKEQRIQLKYSFHQTSYPKYRPEELGNSLGQQLIKDYNGQSYWLSVNISSFIKKENKFPKWLNVACGYGGEGMISGAPNYVILQTDGTVIGNDRYRKFYFSLDADLSRIKTKSKLLKSIFKVINLVKIPAPAIELSNKGVKGYAIYF